MTSLSEGDGVPRLPCGVLDLTSGPQRQFLEDLEIGGERVNGEQGLGALKKIVGMSRWMMLAGRWTTTAGRLELKDQLRIGLEAAGCRQTVSGFGSVWGTRARKNVE